MNKTAPFIFLNLILLISCKNNEITHLKEKVFSLKLNNKWEKRYYANSILLERIDEQLLFQTNYSQNKLDKTEITNTLLKLIETYRKAEMYKSKDSKIGENNYGESNGIYIIRFIGNENNNRFFTVVLFGTTSYVLSVYFEKINTSENKFKIRAREIINKIVLKQ